MSRYVGPGATRPRAAAPKPGWHAAAGALAQWTCGKISQTASPAGRQYSNDADLACASHRHRGQRRRRYAKSGVIVPMTSADIGTVIPSGRIMRCSSGATAACDGVRGIGAQGTASGIAARRQTSHDHIAPRPRITTGTVTRRMRRSSRSDQLSMYLEVERDPVAELQRTAAAHLPEPSHSREHAEAAHQRRLGEAADVAHWTAAAVPPATCGRGGR